MRRKKAPHLLICVALGLQSICSGQNISFRVRGYVTTANGPVRSAGVAFVSLSDTTTRFATLTDSLGSFLIDIPTSVESRSSAPSKFELVQNYPNPFVSATSIPFRVDHVADLRIRIYNVLGQVVRDFKLASKTAGSYSVTWDGTNNVGLKVSPGVYFCRLLADGQSLTKKMIFEGRSGLALKSLAGPSQQVSRNVYPPQPAAGSSASFFVELESTDSTSPPLSSWRSSPITISGDTSFSFLAEELNDFDLCYAKADSGRGQIFINNTRGTHPRNVSN